MIGCRSLTDLSGLSRLPALRTLFINGTAVSNVDDLAGSPLSSLTLLHMKTLDSLNSLQECPELTELTLRDCPRVEEIPAGSLDSLSLSAAGWPNMSSLASQRNLRTLKLEVDNLEDITALTRLPHLAELDLSKCRSVNGLRPLLDMPSLTHLQVPDEAWTFTESGTLTPALTELKARGVRVTVLDARDIS